MVSFANDPVVTDALVHWREKRPMATHLSSAELRALGKQVHGRAVFSARTTRVDYLEDVAENIDDLLSGKINLATARLRLMRRLAELGYDPETGFPEEVAAIPPAERDSLQDLSSERRIDLMLETNLRMAANYGRVLAGNTPYARHAYPAWELVRLYHREVPRGKKRVHDVVVDDPGNAWGRRWAEADQAVAGAGALERTMIARKDSPIWQALGDGAGGYTDTLGNPYPPFAFNSGMAWRAVPRAECVTLGLVNATETPAPMQATFWSPEKAAASLRKHFGSEWKAQLLRELEEAA